MATPVSVVTRTERPLRETPGVVTVVTREEIAASGARDLFDVLRTVPGFSIATGVQGRLALGFRGALGASGQILIRVDGFELNETLYNTPVLDVPIDLIERIEISRGPGSVIYGGHAELAVIDIVTRAHAAGNQVVGGARYGQMEDSLGYRDVYVIGREQVGDVRLGLAASIGQGQRSDGTYRDFFGNAYQLRNRIDPAMIDLGIGWRGLELRLLGHWIATTTQDSAAVSEAAPVETDFGGLFAELRYRSSVAETVTLTPSLTYKRQQPWRVTDPAAMTYYEKTAERLLAALTLDWAVTDDVDVLVGSEAFVNRARIDDPSRIGVGFNQALGEGETDRFATVAGYGQVLVDHPWANLSLGVRVEWNDRFGAVVLPRVGVTRRIGDFYAKLLMGQAFRAPGHEPYSLNHDIRPERTTAFELEAGYQLGEHVHAGINLFDVTIHDPFAYDYDVALGREGYFNFPRTGSRGIEGVVRLQHPRVTGQLSGGYYHAQNQVDLYKVPGRDDVMSGYPAVSLALHGSVLLAHRVTVNPSAVWIGPTWGPMAFEADEVIYGREDSTLLLGLYVRRQDLFVPGLDVGLGVHDLLDQGVRYLARAQIAHAPLPGPSREYVMHVSYRVDLE